MVTKNYQNLLTFTIFQLNIIIVTKILMIVILCDLS